MRRAPSRWPSRCPTAARELAQRFWPGPLTLVLRKKEIVPDLATSGLPNVALRVPAHPVAQALLRAFGGPLAAPSANRFGRISPTDAQAVRAELGEAVPLILDGGPCAVGLESTVLFLSERSAGAAARGRDFARGNRGGGRVRSSTPRRSMNVRWRRASSSITTRRANRCGSCATPAEIPSQARHRLAGLWDAERAGPFAGVVENLSPAGDLREAAANFFRALRALDDDPRVQILYAMPLPAHGLGLAINERLERAAHR